MNQNLIVAPVLVQVLLTFVLLGLMGRTRFGAIARGDVTLQQVALDTSAYPDRSRQMANAYHNQLELPVLFYAVTAFALLTRSVDTVFLVLAWLFVASRLVHALIHTTNNAVLTRFRVFAVGVTLLAIMWVLVGLRALVGVDWI